MPSESSIEQQVVDWAAANDYLVVKMNIQGRKGWPDRLFIYNGHVVFIEFKKPGEVLEPIQDYVHRLLRKHKVPVGVFDTKEEAIGYLESLR